MRIKIRGENSKLSLWLPLSFLKSKFIKRILSKKIEDEHTKEMIDKFVYLACKELRKWKRVYGHLTIVEVESSDNEYVKIVI